MVAQCTSKLVLWQELNGFYIPEMTSVVCKSAAEMVRVMRAGNRNRAAGRTDMNEHSSRSHAVFLVTVETAHRKTNRIRSVLATILHHLTRYTYSYRAVTRQYAKLTGKLYETNSIFNSLPTVSEKCKHLLIVTAYSCFYSVHLKCWFTGDLRGNSSDAIMRLPELEPLHFIKGVQPFDVIIGRECDGKILVPCRCYRKHIICGHITFPKQ